MNSCRRVLAGIIYLAVEIDQGLEERINERQAELAKLRARRASAFRWARKTLRAGGPQSGARGADAQVPWNRYFALVLERFNTLT